MTGEKREERSIHPIPTFGADASFVPFHPQAADLPHCHTAALPHCRTDTFSSPLITRRVLSVLSHNLRRKRSIAQRIPSSLQHTASNHKMAIRRLCVKLAIALAFGNGAGIPTVGAWLALPSAVPSSRTHIPPLPSTSHCTCMLEMVGVRSAWRQRSGVCFALAAVSDEKDGQAVGQKKDQKTAAPSPASQPSVESLLRTIEDMAIRTTSAQSDDFQRMQELEKALELLVETERLNNERSPKPPSTPPSLTTLNHAEDDKLKDALASAAGDKETDKLAMAEAALLQLRQRLIEEEEIMRKAEAAIQRSRAEEETLRRAEEALERSRKAAEERKADAIRRTNEAVAEADAIRQEQMEISKQAFEIETSLRERKEEPRSTISLEDMFFSTSTDGLYMPDGPTQGSSATSSNGAAVSSSTAVDAPIIFDWSQSTDGSIVGKVKGSPYFNDGAKISTSPVAPNAVGGTLVTTGSGSKYFLEAAEKVDSSSGLTATQQVGTQNTAGGDAEGSSTGLNGASMSYGSFEPVITQDPANEHGDAPPIDLKEKRKQRAAKKREAEAKLKIADERRESAKEAREAVRLMEEARLKELELKQAAQSVQKEVEEAQREFATEPKDSEDVDEVNAVPEGMPRIINWSRREDGGVSGEVYGSPNSVDGDLIETSPTAEGSVFGSGKVVKTVSGSEYILFGEPAEKLSSIQQPKEGDDLLSTIKNLVTGSERSTITIPKLETATASPRRSIIKPSSTPGKEQKKEDKEPASKTKDGGSDATSSKKARTTFSLIDLFSGGVRGAQRPTIKELKPERRNPNAPAGVPILSRWKVNSDGTITGVVSGSPHMEDGDLVTTSPIARGRKTKNSTVTTKSGSQYFLD